MTCVILSQMAYSFIISNASRSMHCSSVEAYLLWKCCFNYCSHILIFVAKCDAQSKAWDILLVLTSVAGNLCNKCPSGYSNKTAVKVILSMRSLVSIEQQSPRRPCDSNRIGEVPLPLPLMQYSWCKRCETFRHFVAEKTAKVLPSWSFRVDTACGELWIYLYAIKEIQIERPMIVSWFFCSVSHWNTTIIKLMNKRNLLRNNLFLVWCHVVWREMKIYFIVNVISSCLH